MTMLDDRDKLTLSASSLNFEDTYDGLGDQLEEEDDDLNDDTFGGVGDTGKTPGKDFDFFGSTSKVTEAINEEAMRFNRQQPPSNKPLVTTSMPKSAKRPFKTGYEAYKDPIHATNLQADPSLWGTATASSSRHQSTSAAPLPSTGVSVNPPSRKMMSLEEIEASMFSKPKVASESVFRPGRNVQRESNDQINVPPNHQFPHASPAQEPHSYGTPNLQMPLQQQHQHQHSSAKAQPPASVVHPVHHISRPSQQNRMELPTYPSPAPPPAVTVYPAPHVLQRAQETSQQGLQRQTADAEASQRPRQILQNPNRQFIPLEIQASQYRQKPSLSGGLEIKSFMKGPGTAVVSMPIITHPSQLKDLTDEQREAFMAEDAKRAKRNHKIFLLSKDNGLMTPQDKNFITRIQLQQLMTATGNVNDQDPDTALSEDFYYQVYNQIESRPRQNPNQPLSNFAQTYLFQTGNRPGAMGKRLNRGGDHMHRMQQQVQRAVEAAKLKPKGKQLVIEGSLGKISFSNAKTPKPLLNVKHNDSKVPQATLTNSDRKSVLKNIEAAYITLMKMEGHDRMQPPRPTDSTNQLALEAFHLWRQAKHELNHQLWDELKILEPIMSDSAVLHPFIAFLSYPKGKKAIPRVFVQINSEQRLTILTIIMVQLDTLDVIRYQLPQFASQVSSSFAREQIDLFLQTVMPTLFSYVTKAPLNIVVGLVELLIERVNILAICHTRVGLEILTMFLTQAEIIRRAEVSSDQEWESWLRIYHRLFDTIVPVLADVFPGSVSAGQDVYVWQFLAAVGAGASPEQQQRLVLAVKDRVMETVRSSKTLPPDMASQRRAEVNQFMQAIGLDVEYLDD